MPSKPLLKPMPSWPVMPVSTISTNMTGQHNIVKVARSCLLHGISALENGRVLEYGSYDELCATGNTYARLYNMQAERYR
jgi:hypothetical protein